MTVDEAHAIAKGIVAEAEGNIENIRSEEDAKLQIINRMLVEALGWRPADIGAEVHTENGFSDFVIRDEDGDRFLVEAKKIGVIEIQTHATTCSYFKISGPVLKGAGVPIKQAASYCHPLGIPLAVVTDGLNWIVFLPWVQQASYTERQAVVFPGFHAVLDGFATFYELLSKSEQRKGTYHAIFDSIHENRLILEQSLSAAIPQAENGLEQKSALAFNLDTVFSSFFSELSGDNDPDLLVECFVETRESRVADFSLERITRNVLGNIDPNHRDVTEGLQSVVRSAVEGDVGQTIFLVGPSGAGKTTFLDRFFKRTLSRNVRERCVVIHINSLDATGTETTALSWMTERAISAIEGAIYDQGFPTWDDLQALYHLEYIKRAEGVDKALYLRSKEDFKEKFSGIVDESMHKDREQYLRKLLSDLVKNRKKLPVFIVDNTDEFSLAFKSAVFQYFQALRRTSEHCLIIFPATDRSAWTFSKLDIFNIYGSRSFFLPTPSPREVFRKRIDYLNSKISPTLPERQQSEYLMGKGIRVTIRDLRAFASVVERVFVDQDYAAKRVGELSNYNMRKALGLAKRVITSSVLNVEDLIRSYFTGSFVAPTLQKFMSALLRGDYEYFKPGDEPLLFPIFQVDHQVRQSPLLHVRVLLLLRGLHQAAQGDDELRYITIQSLQAYLGVMAVPEIAAQRSVEGLMAAGLMEPYDLSKKDLSPEQRVAITHSGLAHLELALFNPVYFEQMALTTSIVDGDITAQMRGAFRSTKPINERLEVVRAIFCRYLCDEDGRHSTVPERGEFEPQAALKRELLAQWGPGTTRKDELRPPKMAAAAVVATVESFDQQKGFGFVDVPELNERVFLHANVVTQSGFKSVYDGDDILCDVGRNERGLAVAKIYEVQTPNLREVPARIVKLLAERQYGFAHVDETNMDVFFHYHVFSPAKIAELREGQELMVEVKMDRQGRAQVRRVVQ